ncbi:MAPEG family protein [Sphingomonas sp.]|uniref:MAPEG family protein n=1 Tax=Sphingomonas sp. TaxID=28214 RepID=UPI003CC50F71
MMILPQVSLVLAAALALINCWLSFRVGQVRGSEKVSIGDGGNDRVIRRMRAHANFVENAWAVLALVLVIELSVGTSIWLWAAAALFVAGRIGHAFGMDGWYPGRTGGTGITLGLQLILAIWAVVIPLKAHRAATAAPVAETTVPQG